MPPGMLIVDNNCLSYLRRGDALGRFRGSLRAADLVVVPTEVNLVEATAASPDALQADLIETLRAIAGEEALLPWPFTLLRDIGLALTRGEFTYHVPASGKEWYLDDPAALQEIREEIVAFNQNLEEAFTALHESTRRRLRAALKARKSRTAFEDARDFLERQWFESDLRRHFASVTWRSFGLPEPVPFELLEANEAWRLLLDVEGLAVYERAVAWEEPRRVHRRDLIQLIYLSGSRRRILVTADRGLLRAGEAVLRRRYLNARVAHISEMIAPAE
jgi:hypothetical protein